MLLNKAGTALIAYPSAAGSVTLPNTITAIGDQAFSGCTALTTLSLPGATTIGGGVFERCTALTTVSLPGVTDIGNYAFSRCTGLTTLSLPATPPTRGNRVFNYTNLDAGAGTTLTIKVYPGTETAYTAAPPGGWGVSPTTPAGNTVYGYEHKEIVIDETP
jgi:hypothetical protein